MTDSFLRMKWTDSQGILFWVIDYRLRPSSQNPNDADRNLSGTADALPFVFLATSSMLVWLSEFKSIEPTGVYLER